MSQDVIRSPRIYEGAREPHHRARRVVLPTLALFALAGPVLAVGALIVWGLFRASPVARDPALELDTCQRAVTCCEALEGAQAEACRPVLQLAGRSSGVPASDQWVQSSTLAECQMELRRMHGAAVTRGESIPACVPTPQ